MFAGDSKMLRNKRHFFISVITINVFYCIEDITFKLWKGAGNHLFLYQKIDGLILFIHELTLFIHGFLQFTRLELFFMVYISRIKLRSKAMFPYCKGLPWHKGIVFQKYIWSLGY